LLNLLFHRELKVRYKDSALGFVWTLIKPLAQLLIYAIVIGKFLEASRSTPQYPIYVFSGLTIWQLFSEIVLGGTGSVLANGGLIKKVYLPREVFPLSVVCAALFNFLMQLGILVAGTFISGSPPVPSNLIYAVLSIVIVILYGTGLAFILGAVNVYLRDIQYLVEIGLMWGMWASPIVYNWSLVQPHLAGHPWLEKLYLSDPMTQAVLGFQRAFWRGGNSTTTIPHLGRDMIICIAVGVVFLWLGQRLFARLQANFAQEL
jgi:ABC-2 type transport system permease protein